MGTVVLAGATSGSTTLSPTDAVTAVLTMPTGTDTLVGKATTDTLTNKTLTAPVLSGSVTGTYTLAGTPTMGASVLTSATAQASTSGTSINFTGIPSWVKRITVMFSGVSTNGASNYLIQLGTSSGVETTGYLSTCYDSAFASATTGFLISSSVASGNTRSGNCTICLVGSNLWTESGIVGRTDSASGGYNSGNKTLAGTLDRVRITMVNGTDTFDAGSINIMYE